MPTNLSGSDVVNMDVRTLIEQNQSENETNIAASLNTRTVKETSQYTASDEKIFGDVHVASSTTKTFGVYPIKQVVEAFTPPSVRGETTTVDVLSSDTKSALERASGITVTDNQSLVEATSQVEQNLTEMLETRYGVRDGLIPFAELDLYIPDLPEGFDAPPLAYGNLKDSALEGISLKQFEDARSAVNGVLSDFNSCPDLTALFSGLGGFFDISALLGALMKMLGLGLDLGCFSDLLQKLGNDDVNELLSVAGRQGDVSGVNAIVGSVGLGKVKDPEGLATETLGGISLSTNSSGAEYLDSDLTTNLDTMFSTLGISSSSIYTTPGGVVDKPKIDTLNPAAKEYLFGADKTFMASLPI